MVIVENEVSERTDQRKSQPDVFLSASSHPLNLYASTYLKKHRVITEIVKY